MPCRLPVEITLAAAASTFAPHSARKQFVTLRKMTDGRGARSQALLV
jgi:hypothetical protein